ncbi:MAG: hypothetical protein EBQ92_06945 [Proteobacteria bacterium]|nr:hypothetical protein [Pseudomonadota bacterium]
MEKLVLILAAFNWGAICFVSVVHYPLFADVHSDVFVEYHRKHVTRTTLLLGSTLSLEMVLQIFLFLMGPKDLFSTLPLLFLGAGWLITFLVSVPQHRKLEQGFSKQAHQILMLSNWGRVVCWGITTILLAL